METKKYQIPTQKIYCEQCHYFTYKQSDFNKHISTRKHLENSLETNGDNKVSDIISYHSCYHCNYTTNIKSNYDKHLLTEKHKKNVSGEPDEIKHICSQCNKEYSNYNSLWKHKKHCVVITEREPEPLQNTFIPGNIITSELFMEVFRESKELRDVLIEQNKELQNKLMEQQNIVIEQNNKIIELASKQTTNNVNSNNTNNQFNLQFYLNETCKDAMNIVDFVNSLTLTTEDFETTGQLGFVEGISRIFIKALKQMEKEKLPIHCTDLKRETVYIKDKNIWEKENDDKRKLKWTIDRIAQLNLNQNQNWLEKYPVCKENNTKENEKFTAMALVALGGRGEEEDEKFREKIMRNVLKEVVLDKQCKVLN